MNVTNLYWNLETLRGLNQAIGNNISIKTFI